MVSNTEQASSNLETVHMYVSYMIQLLKKVAAKKLPLEIIIYFHLYVRFPTTCLLRRSE